MDNDQVTGMATDIVNNIQEEAETLVSGNEQQTGGYSTQFPVNVQKRFLEFKQAIQDLMKKN